MSKKYRLVTRSDMDGLVCAVLLKQLNMIDEIKFVHPKDMQDGKITITQNANIEKTLTRTMIILLIPLLFLLVLSVGSF